MSNIFDKDFLIEVQRGNVHGFSLVHKFGANVSVPNGSWELISLLSAPMTHLSAATTVRIKAGGNANDAAAGTGAQKIVVQGVDSSLNETTETIVTNGINASAATSTSFWRVYRLYIPDAGVGTYGGANTGAITIENSGGGTDIIVMAAGYGQSLYTGWAVPTGKTAYLLGIYATVDTNKIADIRIRTRNDFNDVSTPFSPARVRDIWTGISEKFIYQPRSPEIKLDALTDIWMEAYGNGATAAVSAGMELLVIDD